MPRLSTDPPAGRNGTVAICALALSGLWAGLATLHAENTPAAAATADSREIRSADVSVKSFPPVLRRGEFPLDFVRDRTDLEGTADRGAYFGLLDYVRHVDPEALKASAAEVLQEKWQESKYRDWPREEFPLFAELLQRPEEYRGAPLTLRGHIQLHRVFHQQNEFGLDPFHEVYLYTSDSQGHPAAVVFTENPDNVPVGEERINGIEANGYFLKLITYPSRDGKLRYAPLILAREIRWREAVAPSLSPAMQLAILGGILTIVLGLVVLMRWTRRQDDIARERERRLLEEQQSPDFSSLP